jgi:hypothetical protein
MEEFLTSFALKCFSSGAKMMTSLAADEEKIQSILSSPVRVLITGSSRNAIRKIIKVYCFTAEICALAEL